MYLKHKGVSMPEVAERKNTVIISKPLKAKEKACYHCGTECITASIAIDDKLFCCEGCKLVYEIINQNGLCNYYDIGSHPGLSQVKPVRSDKYAYLDNEEIAQKLYAFTDGDYTIATFYIPGVHCASCMWLLEHMQKLNAGIVESRLNFSKKEVSIRFRRNDISLRGVVELLTTIGYEPYISLEESDKKKKSTTDKKRLYRLGIAGFCFGNIMLMSFPEYLSLSKGMERDYSGLFRLLNLGLSVPVFFYCASEFFTNAWAGLKQKMLNIDAPIALAIIIMFARSIYEIATGTGAGYLDSLSGIVFFMLAGRVIQDRTYQSISFHRDYKSYFPIAVDVITPTAKESRHLQDLKQNDIVLLHHEEIVPADAKVLKGRARIDYSFVTGESEPVIIEKGQTVYAGGKQVGEEITLQILKPVAGSYLTSLWNHNAFSNNKVEQNRKESVIHTLSKYFTIVLLVLVAATTIYWAFVDTAKIIPSVTAMLIIACPCALLLAVTFTNGNLLRLLSNSGLYLRDAFVIEQLGNIQHIVFDKTGTLTENANDIKWYGDKLSDKEKRAVYSIAKQSTHPYSKAITHYLKRCTVVPVENWSAYTGKGVQGIANGYTVQIGSETFVNESNHPKQDASCYIKVNNKVVAIDVVPRLRDGINDVFSDLDEQYSLSLLSGDNAAQKNVFSPLFNCESPMLFNQKPEDKLEYISSLQAKGEKVLMVGDGLNDAGALQQSNVGITLADDINNFTPSCDAILDAKRFASFPGLLKLARSGKTVINITFAVSIIYNIIGLSISMQGLMNPLIAAILMPASTLTIVLLTTGLSTLMAKTSGLTTKQKHDNNHVSS